MKQTWFRRARLLIGIFLVIISAVMLVERKHAEVSSENKFSSIAQRIESDPSYADGVSEMEIRGSESQAIKVIDEIKSELQILKEENADLEGWIKIIGSQINYPVMYTPEEPEYYLNRDFDKAQSIYGTPFIDGRCDMGAENCANIIIYGHHMKNGSMFADLQKYSDQSYQNEHSVIEFNTLNSKSKYQVIAAFSADAGLAEAEIYDCMTAETDEKFRVFLSFAKEHSYYDIDETAVFGEQLITLVTCEYSRKDGRFFVVAKKIESTN